MWPPNYELVKVSILGGTDPNGDSVTIRVNEITSDELTNTKNSGDPQAPGAYGLGKSSALLRAERLGTGNGARA